MPALFSIHRARYDGALVQPRHQHDTLQLSMLLTGSVEETVGATAYRGMPLHIAAKDAGLEHANRWGERGARIIRLEVHGQSLASISDATMAPAWRWKFDPVAVRAFLRIAANTVRSQLSSDDVDCSDLLAALVARPAPIDSGRPPAWLINVVETIADAWTPQLDTARLAHQAAVHPVYLARCVRRWFGISLGDLLRTERLRHTVAHLAHTRERVALVAYGAGFSDEAHCTRTVRNALGLTPAALRRLLHDEPRPHDSH